MDVSTAVAERRSIRAFRPDPIPPDVIGGILEKAQRAPSGGNIQAWAVHVLTGAALDGVITAVQARFDAGGDDEPREHLSYPEGLVDPYRTRRRVVGEQLYELIGVPRSDRPGKLRQLRKNFAFFGAPVGLIFTIKRQMEPIQWTDLGIYIQTILLLATEQGLGSCAQGAWSFYPQTLKRVLGLPDDEIVVCGMALGHADESAPINALISERATLEETVTFHEQL